MEVGLIQAGEKKVKILLGQRIRTCYVMDTCKLKLGKKKIPFIAVKEEEVVDDSVKCQSEFESDKSVKYRQKVLITLLLKLLIL